MAKLVDALDLIGLMSFSMEYSYITNNASSNPKYKIQFIFFKEIKERKYVN